MRLSRIKRMSKKRKAVWVKAIDELARAYKKDEHDWANCPFCKIAGCKGCLWRLFEGMGC